MLYNYSINLLTIKKIKIMSTKKYQPSDINLTQISRDVNGNPRYVCHFLVLANEYPRAIALANSIGGKKYHTKSYGGGLVFQSYNTDDLKRRLSELSER